MPESGGIEVARLDSLRVFFDRMLAPRSVVRGNVQLVSGNVAVLRSVRWDPVSQAVVASPFGEVPLEPNIQYRLRLSGLRDLEDRFLEEPIEIPFRTGMNLGLREVPREVGFAEVEALLQRRCANQGCHGGDEPAVGLDLSSAEGIRRTTNRRARQSPATTSIHPRGTRVLVGLPIIDRVAGTGRPETSYLLYKILGEEHILGEPMPPDEPLSEGEIRNLSDWIRGGAPTDG
ncbi:MAG: hypothetical protein AAGF12_27605 [Myxococcota bacterium]